MVRWHVKKFETDSAPRRGRSTYNKHLENTPAGNDGYSGFYLPLQEIIPPNVHGEFFFKDGERVNTIPDLRHACAILDSSSQSKSG